MTTFTTAAEVRSFLKGAGFTERLRIKRTTSPFTGALFFTVFPADVPVGATIASSGGSQEPTHWFCSEPDFATRLNAINDALSKTNAFVGGST